MSGWRSEDRSRSDARMFVQIARDIREERQALGDNRDNGDASCLDKAAERRREAAEGRR